MSRKNAADMDNNSSNIEYVSVQDEDEDESDSEKSTKPIKVVVSKLFQKDDSEDFSKCTLCSQDVHYSAAALKYHIMTKHSGHHVGNTSDEENTHLDEACDDEGKDEQDSFEPPLQGSSEQQNGRARSANWEYFTMVDQLHKIASCNACGRELSYSTLSNLKKHLKRKHGDGVRVEMSNSETSLLNRKRRYHGRTVNPYSRFRSITWKYFAVVDAQTKLASCKFCLNTFSYNCLSNLMKHLRRKHRHEIQFSDEEDARDDVTTDDHNSPEWSYFQLLSQELKIAGCLICKKRVDYTTSRDLTKHLSKKHPQVHAELQNGDAKPKKLMITDSGDVYEIENGEAKQERGVAQDDENDSDWPYNNDQDDTLDNPEYLDENIFNESNEPTENKRLIIQPNKQKVLYNKQTRNKCTEKDTPLDIFGKYMVSLLKKLPKHKADKLQADFVKQIMEAQNDSENTHSRRNTCSTSSIKTSCSLSSIKNTSADDVASRTSDGENEHLVKSEIIYST